MKSKLLYVLCLLCCILYMQYTSAQSTTTITGTVISSDDKSGLPGVSVKLKGTAISTQTDAKGNYSINVPATNSVLVFSYISFITQEKQVSGARVINVTLETESTSLNEVVVIGYGELRRDDLTGAVSSVKMPDIQKAPVRSFEEALAGRVAGVTASADDGQPGSNINIVIRGNNSITQDNSPLYVIDGFPVENPDNNALNPQEIESIDVLKDASSTAIYGARGANGVIVITTKKGKEGKPVINYNGFYGFMQNTNAMDLMGSYDYVKYLSERDPARAAQLYLDSIGRTLEDYRNVKAISLQDSLFGNVPFTNHSLSLSGGAKGTRYLISGSILDQDGIIINSGYNRYQGRVNIDQTVNERFKVGLNTTYSNMKQFGTSPSTGGNGFYHGNLLYSVWAFRPVSASIFEVDQDLEDQEDEFLVLSGFNPIKTAQNEVRESYSNVFTANVSGDYTFAKYFTLRVTGGITSTRRRNVTFNGSMTPRGSPTTKAGQDNGINGEILFFESTTWLNENTLTFNRKFNRKHQLNVLVGATAQGLKRKTSGTAANHLPNEYLLESGFDEGTPIRINSTSGLYTLASFLGRVNYTFNEKYLFTASMRSDGSSKFSKANRWGYFPSAAFAWRLSDEKFMKPLTFLSNAKLRASYGATGNNRVDDFAYLSRLALPASLGYSFTEGGIPSKAAELTELGNLNLKWETTVQSNIGLDLGFIDQRISLEADVYRKVTSDLLLDAAVPGSIGFNTAIKNIGKVQNEGIELNLNTINFKGKNFGWSSNFNISFNRNKVLALSDGETVKLNNAAWNTLTTNVPLYIAEIGQPIARFYGYDWIGNYQLADFDENTPGVYTLKADVPRYSQTAAIQPGDIKFRDVNEDGKIDANDATIIGDPNPDYTGGFSNNLNYKNFDLNVFFQFSVGGDLMNANRIIFEGGGQTNQNMFATYNNRWTFENQNNEHYRTGGGGPATYSYSSRVVEDGSYLKLKTVALGYTLPKQLLNRAKISNARIYISAQNLHTWTKYQGFDPEVSKFGGSALRPGFDYSVYPHARTVTFGLNVSL